MLNKMRSKLEAQQPDSPPIEVEPDACLVAESTLPNAGNGLFAAKDLPGDVFFVEYTGEVLNFQQARLRKDRSYVKAVGLDKHIDAADPSKSSVARYINDVVDPAKRNCKFHQDKGRVYVKTTRPVRKGDEFFIEYGRGHWLYCEDTPLAESFLALRLIRDGSGGVRSDSAFESGNFLCTYSSLHWKKRFGPGIGVAVRRQSLQFPDTNCKLQRNPLLKGTIFVQSTRAIESGEELILERHVAFDTNVMKAGVYVTGFGKFRGVAENPTTFLISNLRPYINECGILGCAVWETSTHGVKEGLVQANQVIGARYAPAKNLTPSKVTFVHFGVDSGANCFALESRAVNLADFGVPDERGYQPRASPIDKDDGSSTSFRKSMLDLNDICARLRQLGYNVIVSDDAGAYICNYAYYSSLKSVTTSSWGHDESLFVHVPSLEVSDQEHQLRFARDLLNILARESCPSRNAFNLVRSG